MQKELRRKKIIETIWKNGERFQSGLRELLARHALPATLMGYPPEFTIVFQHSSDEVNNILSTLLSQEFARRNVFWGGVFYVLYTHTASDIRHVLDAADEVFALAATGLRGGTLKRLLKVQPKKPLFRRRLV